MTPNADAAPAAERFPAVAALHEKASVVERVAAVMSDCWRIEKSGKNEQQGYAFAQEGDITEMLRAAMGRARLILHATIVGEDRYVAKFRNSEGTGVIVHVDYTLLGPNDSLPASRWSGEATDNSDKAVPKALTAAKKSYLVHTFLLSTGVDPDAGGELSSRGAAQPPAPREAISPRLASEPQIRRAFALARSADIDPELIRLSARLMTRTRDLPDGLGMHDLSEPQIRAIYTLIEEWPNRPADWDTRLGKMAARLDSQRQDAAAEAPDVAPEPVDQAPDGGAEG
jgi:hypothetical protein